MPAAMQGLMVVPLFAGYDLQPGASVALWNFDVTGGRYEEDGVRGDRLWCGLYAQRVA